MGEDFLGFVMTKQTDGTIVGEHAFTTSHASHASHASGRREIPSNPEGFFRPPSALKS
jgi:hypothetical protein